jgi:hypothetical protein
MAVNDKIYKADYNTIRNKVATILGTGAANSGYGQPLKSAEVTESSKVTVNEWANLYYDIVNCYVHQSGSQPASPSSAVEGATVRYNTTTSPYTQYDTFANTAVSNKFNIAGSQSFTTSKGSTSQTWPGTYGSYWTSKVQCFVTVSFTNANKARGFFNSGGEIRFSSSRSGGTANPTNTANVGWRQNESWTNFLATVNPVFGGNKPNTGVDPNDGTNFYRLSSTFGQFYSATASSPYGANSFRVSARTPAVADNSTGTASSIEFYFEWIDAYTNPVPGGGLSATLFPPGDGVDGTISLSCTTLEATGVLVPAGSGNFTVESPSVTIGTITT